MNDTPELDDHDLDHIISGTTLDFCRLDEAREQRDNCQLELEIVIERLKGNRHPDDNGMKYEGEIDIKAITAQRDRLAEALEQILSYQGKFAEEDPESIATEALESLNNFPQTPAK